MHGPYRATIAIGSETIALGEKAPEIAEGRRVAELFYADATPALARGMERAASFAAALLLGPGEEAEIVVYGYEGSGKSEREIQVARHEAYRDALGAAALTVGSRFGTRFFRGI